ncbi:MAG TPA: hypothetical protein VNT26_11760, partial [Candidatus Sulfotelmatobacter sp.]|nr:hypothetical protein [Candidatus Sulfotelmatobacter sp.]
MRQALRTDHRLSDLCRQGRMAAAVGPPATAKRSSAAMRWRMSRTKLPYISSRCNREFLRAHTEKHGDFAPVLHYKISTKSTSPQQPF